MHQGCASVHELLEVLLTLPMRGRGSSNHCVCLCVCFHSSERYEFFKSQSKVPTESTRCREQNNIGIELKILGSKVMTVITLP